MKLIKKWIFFPLKKKDTEIMNLVFPSICAPPFFLFTHSPPSFFTRQKFTHGGLWQKSARPEAKKPSELSPVLAEVAVFSYLECVMVCGQDSSCRVAVFNSDLLTCMSGGPGSYTSFTEDKKCQTFIRFGFTTNIP